MATDSYGKGAVVMALPFIAVGLFFVYAGFVDPDLLDDVNGPVWLLGFVGATFALAGMVLFFRGTQGVLRERGRARSRRRYPGQPWRFDYPWHADGVTDDAADRVLSGVVATLVLGVFLVPFVWWGFFSDDAELALQFVVGLFLLVWLLSLGTVAYRALQFLKYGSSRLSFSQFPFALGAPMTVGFSNGSFERIRAELRFVEEKYVARGTGQQRTVSQECWQHYSEVRMFDAQPGEFVRIEFALPSDPALANQLIPDPAIRYWELLVEAQTPGIDFRTSYPLPVYAGPIAPRLNGGFGVAHAQGRWRAASPSR